MENASVSDSPLALLLCDDLMFTSRITGTARALSLTVKPARSVADLEALAGQQKPRCVIIDLGHPGLNIGGLVRRFRPDGAGQPFIVAYGSHVDSAGLQAARAAGCDVVLPRSKFADELPTALPRWLNPLD